MIIPKVDQLFKKIRQSNTLKGNLQVVYSEICLHLSVLFFLLLLLFFNSFWSVHFLQVLLFCGARLIDLIT